MIIYKPQSLLVEGKYVFFDIFYINNCIILISPVYNYPMDENKNIIITFNKIPVCISDLYCSRFGNQSSLVIKYNLITQLPIINITISYKNVSYIFTLNNDQSIGNDNSNSKQQSTAITTLFKDDFNLIHVFYNYYLKQGIKHFYLYYNGKLTDVILKEFCNYNITLVEWDFWYWNDSHSFKHHAQMGQLQHALYMFGKPYHSYMAFCDLDEYLNIENINLQNYIIKYPNNYYYFANHWAKTLCKPRIYKDPLNILYSEISDPLFKKCKMIYNTNYVLLVGVHFPLITSCGSFEQFFKEHIVNSKLKSFHFYNWTKTDRVIDLQSPIKYVL